MHKIEKKHTMAKKITAKGKNCCSPIEVKILALPRLA